MSDTNPYQAPKVPVVDQRASPSPTRDELSKMVLAEEEVRAFVGSKADYYLKAWNATDERGAPQITLNWPALLLCLVWFPYRKMYRATVILYAAAVALAILEDLLFVRVLGMPSTPSVVGTIQGLLIGIVCGAFGNEWYRWHARRLVAKLRALRLPEHLYLAALSKRGGVSILAPVGSIFVLLGAAVVFVILEDLLLPGRLSG